MIHTDLSDIGNELSDIANIESRNRPSTITTSASGYSVDASLNPQPQPKPMDIEVGDDLDGMAEVDQLIALGARPDPVDDVPPLPPGASARLHLIRNDYIRVLGLRRSIDLPDDVIYGRDWVAARVGLGGRHVSRLLKQLVELGVLAEPVAMERMGKPRGTYSYRPGKPGPVPPCAGDVE
jgi:hypothetical protein